MASYFSAQSRSSLIEAMTSIQPVTLASVEQLMQAATVMTANPQQVTTGSIVSQHTICSKTGFLRKAVKLCSIMNDVICNVTPLKNSHMMCRFHADRIPH